MRAGRVPSVRAQAPNLWRRWFLALWFTLVAGPYVIFLIGFGAILQTDESGCFWLLPPSCAIFGITLVDVIAVVSRPWSFVPAWPSFALLIAMSTVVLVLAQFAFRGAAAQLAATVFGTFLLLQSPTLLRTLYDQGREYRLCPHPVLKQEPEREAFQRLKNASRFNLGCRSEPFHKEFRYFHLRQLRRPNWLYDRAMPITGLMLFFQLMLLSWRQADKARRPTRPSGAE